MVSVADYGSVGPGSIPGTSSDFSEVGRPGRGALSLVIQIEELLDREVAAPVMETTINGRGCRHADHMPPNPAVCLW